MTNNQDTTEQELDKLVSHLYSQAEANEIALRNHRQTIEEYFAHRDAEKLEAKAAIKSLLLKERRDTIWQIMSPKTEGLFDDGELFIKRAPIEQAIINMIGYEEYKAMQEAVDALQQQLNNGEGA